MKKTIALLTVCGTVIALTSEATAQNAGDTIVVPAFNYDSQTRDTVIDFPDLQGVTYEKVLMQYSMRCHDGTINTGGGNTSGPNASNGCGEWDYGCNTYLIDSTRIDSVLNIHPSHTVSGFSGTTYNYSIQPTYTFYEYSQQQVTINSTTSETIGALGAGSATLNDVMSVQYESGKSQYLVTAAELTGAGLAAGDLTGLRLNVLSGSSSADFLRIRIKSTAATGLDPTSVDLTGFTEVYFYNYAASAGLQQFQFYTPFNWDGTSNIIVELNFTSGATQAVIDIEGETAPASSVLTSQITDHYADLSGGGAHIDVPDATYDFSNGFSASAWVRWDNLNNWSRVFDFGNGAGADNIILANVGTSNELRFNVRGSGASIDLSGANAIVTGEWMHVAVSIEPSGNAALYVNGSVVASTSSCVLPDNVQRANQYIGRSNWSHDGYFDGQIDDFSMWNTALTQAEIQNWMYRDLDATHPQYASLLFSYNFNDGNTTQATDLSPNASNGVLQNYIPSPLFDGRDIFKNMSATTQRPNIDLLQGVYNQTVTEVAVMDSVLNAPNQVISYTVVEHPGIIMSDEVNPVDTNTYWEAVTQSIYDAETGALIGTVPTSTDGSITITDLNYHNRWPGRYEVLSLVTPYGIGLDLGMEGKMFTFDITDYLPIMKGPKRFVIEGAGWQEELDVKFLFLVGTPPRDVVEINQIWRVQTRNYQEIMADRFFPPRDVPTDASAEYFKVRSAISGHGQEGEFIPQQHTMNVGGGATEFQWQVWKECAENPMYPQGGTWVYDRAGWCPGMATDVRHNDITQLVTPGQPVNLDYSVVTAQGDSRYVVNNQLVQYGPANHTLDAAVVEVMEPSKRFEFDRFNSMCNQPKVRIRNTGSTELTSLTISYWVNNAQTPITFNWTGNLAFMAEEEVTLPAPIWLWEPCNQTDNQFHVELSNPNGGTDEYAHNNHYISMFDIPDVMPDHMIVWFKTNNAPNESSYEIIDEYSGTVIHSRSGMTANTLYKDTIQLGVGGCYVYKVYDTDDDGISWWANNDGSGYTRFQEVGGTIVKAFEPDFGDNINYHFTVDFPLSYEEINDLESVEVHPNPTEDKINVSLRGFDNKVDVQLINHLGQVVYTDRVNTENGLYQGTISMEAYQDGMYILLVTDGIQTSRTKVVKN